MLRQAFHGARWYVAHSRPSVRAFSAITPRRLDYGGPNDKVTFYEQDAPGSKKRRKIDPEAEDNEERKGVENELAKLRDELKVLEEGPFSPNSPFIRSLPDADRKIALEALENYEREQGEQEPQPSLDEVFDEELDEMLKEEFEGLALEQENPQKAAKRVRQLSGKRIETGLAEEESHPYTKRFHDCVVNFKTNSEDERTKHELWRWYRRCKQVIPEFLESMPQETRQIMWQSQNTADLTSATRSTHLQTLIEDAKSVNQPFATPQILTYITALHDSGSTNKALEQWEAYQAELSQSKEDLEPYWMLGVRLFAAGNNPQRAQDIALAFLMNDRSRQPRVLIPVITAWGKLPGEEAEVKAWALYLQLKTFLGSDMGMEDYDNISIGLLTAGRLDTAVAVFKDMMVTGQDPAKDSTALYKAALGLAGNLHASSINEEAVNKVSLSALTVLPRQFQNRFFYASWMKKLIGMGEVDSAALVIELMYERGVKPDSKHLNGVIAGWLRDGSAGARDKAERLGWSMIQRRIDAAWKKFQPTKAIPQLGFAQDTVDPARIPKFMKRDVPQASIETFSILLLHYTRRGDDGMIKYLVKSLGDAQIQPNSYFMNHLLYADLRKQDIKSLWTKFQAISQTVRPDLETYACLWDCAKIQYDHSRTAYDPAFPSARQLFAHMTRWYAQLSPRSRKAAQSEFSKGLYDQIIRGFCLSKDVPGTLVALHAMRAFFGFAPDDATARLIVLQVARLAGIPADTPKRRLRRLSSTPRSKENIAQVNQLLEILGDRKAASLQVRGLSLDQLDLHERQQYQLEIMVSLLRIVLSRSDGLDPAGVEEKLANTAAEMQVVGLDLGPPIGVDDSQLLL